MQALNSPLELGLRALVILTACFPRSLNLDQVVLMDYCLLHSADFDGPVSVHPAVPARSGEIGLKRSVIEHGLQVMTRAGMVDLVATTDGVTYRASEQAAPFLRLVDSPLLAELNEIAVWSASEFDGLTTEGLRDRIRSVANAWTEQWTDDASQALLTWSESDPESGEISL